MGKKSFWILIAVFLFIFSCKKQPQSMNTKSLVVAVDSTKLLWSIGKAQKVFEGGTTLEELRDILDTLSWKNKFEAAPIYKEIGFQCSDKGHYYASKNAFEKYINLYKQNNIAFDKNADAAIYKNLTVAFNMIGDYDKAIYFGKKGIEFCESVPKTERIDEIRAYLYAESSTAYFNKNDFKEALYTAKLGIDSMLKSGIKNENKLNSILNYLYINEIEALGKQDTLLAFQKAKELINKTGIQSDSSKIICSIIYQKIGDIYSCFSNNRESVAAYQQAINIYPNKTDRLMSKLCIRLGEFLYAQDENIIALQHAQSALHFIFPNYNERNVWKNPKAADFYEENAILEALELKGAAAAAMYAQTKQIKWLFLAKKSNELARKMSEKLLENMSYTESKLSERSMSSVIYQQQFSALATLYEGSKDKKYIEEAFQLTEQSRAYLIREELYHRQAIKLLDNEDYTAINELKIELSELKQEEVVYGASKEMMSLIKKKNQKLNWLENKLIQQYPLYAQQKQRTAVCSGKEASQKLLQNDKGVLLSYFCDEEKELVYIIAIGADGQNLFLTKSLSPQALTDFYKFCNTEVHNNVFEQNFPSLSKQLYDILLSDIFFQWADCPSISIVSEGQLAMIPFDALLTTAVKDKQQMYLCQKTFVHYLLSATTEILQQKNIKPRSKVSYLGIAPSYEQSIFDNVIEGENCVKNIQSKIGGETLLNTSASADNFRTYAPKFDIIHFYGHAKADFEKYEQSFLVMTPKKKSWWASFFIPKEESGENMLAAMKIPKDEELLLANELGTMDLNVSLVVLNACETGIGKNAIGEGAMSLSRMLFGAGVHCTMMSQWSINSGATAKITTSFFNYLHQGKRKDEALTYAKRDFVRQNPNQQQPFFWAGLALLGNIAPCF